MIRKPAGKLNVLAFPTCRSSKLISAEALVAVLVIICSLRVSVPTPGTCTCVLGPGLAAATWPATVICPNWPVAVASGPVGPTKACTVPAIASAVTRPPSRLSPAALPTTLESREGVSCESPTILIAPAVPMTGTLREPRLPSACPPVLGTRIGIQGPVEAAAMAALACPLMP